MKLFNAIAAAAVIGASLIATRSVKAGGFTCQYLIKGENVRHAPCTVRTENRGDRINIYAADRSGSVLYTLYPDGTASAFKPTNGVHRGSWNMFGDRPMIRIYDSMFSYY